MKESNRPVSVKLDHSQYRDSAGDNYEDIDLGSYLEVLWRFKYFILICTIFPCIFMGLFLYFSPKTNSLAYTYTYGNWNLDSNKFEMFLESFYSGENLGRIISNLRSDGVEDFAILLETANGRQSLEKYIKFETWSPEETEESVSYLNKMTLVAPQPREDLMKTASVIRSNVEDTIPIFDIERDLMSEINSYRTKMAKIEEGRFSLKSKLDAKTNVLKMLKNIEVDDSKSGGANLTLQFDVAGQGEFLPLAYHIQAAEAGIVKLKEQDETSEAEFKYYDAITDLNKKLLTEIRSHSGSGYSILKFMTFLSDLISTNENEVVDDYLAAYIKKLENRVLLRNPVTETPQIHSLAKGIIKKSLLAFCIFLLFSVFISLMWDSVRRIQSMTA